MRKVFCVNMQKMKKFIDNVAMKNYNNFTAINYKRRRKL